MYRSGAKTLETRGRDCLIPGLPPFPLRPPVRSRTPAEYRRLCRCGRLHFISVALHRGRHARAVNKAGFAKSSALTGRAVFSPTPRAVSICRRVRTVRKGASSAFPACRSRGLFDARSQRVRCALCKRLSRHKRFAPHCRPRSCQPRSSSARRQRVPPIYSTSACIPAPSANVRR